MPRTVYGPYRHKSGWRVVAIEDGRDYGGEYDGPTEDKDAVIAELARVLLAIDKWDDDRDLGSCIPGDLCEALDAALRRAGVR